MGANMVQNKKLAKSKNVGWQVNKTGELVLLKHARVNPKNSKKRNEERGSFLRCHEQDYAGVFPSHHNASDTHD